MLPILSVLSFLFYVANGTGTSPWRGLTRTAHSSHYGADDTGRSKELLTHTAIQQGKPSCKFAAPLLIFFCLFLLKTLYWSRGYVSMHL